MEWEGVAAIAALLTAITATIGGIITGALKAYRWWRGKVKADLLAEQSKRTIGAKNTELHELRAENRRLWQLLDQLTRPPEGH